MKIFFEPASSSFAGTVAYGAVVTYCRWALGTFDARGRAMERRVKLAGMQTAFDAAAVVPVLQAGRRAARLRILIGASLGYFFRRDER